MLGFAVLVSNDGQPIDPDLIQRVERSSQAELPFSPERSMQWANRSRSVIALGWEAITDIGGVETHWHGRPDGGLVAFAGYCWPSLTGWEIPGLSWATQLDAWLGDRDPMIARDDLFGEFVLLRLDPDGRGQIVNDTLGCGPIFTTTVDRCTVITNRAGIAAIAATPPGQLPVRSPLAAGWLIFDSSIVSEETGYLDVEHLPYGARVAIEPELGARIVEPRVHPLFDRYPHDLPQTYDGLVPLMAVHLESLVRIANRLPADRRELRLSGGKDSRLLAAAIVASGSKDRYIIRGIGAPEMADPRVARQIATDFGFRWQLEDRRGRPASVEIEMVERHTFLTEGLVSGWNTTALIQPQHDLTLTGVGGDYIGWRQESVTGRTARTLAAAMAQFANRDEFDRFGLLLQDAKAWYLSEIERWCADRLDRGIDPGDLRALYLRETRTRTTTGIASAVEPRLWIDGFAHPLWFRASFQLPTEQRAGFRFHVDLLQTLCPAMLSYPLAEKAWTPESVGHRPDRDRLLGLTPVRGAGGDHRHWRVIEWDRYRPQIEERVLDRTNPLYQVADIRRVERLLRRPADGRTIRPIYAVLTAALWLGHAEDRRQIRRSHG